METQLLHRGRLIDHIQLVVADLKASRAFCGAIFELLNVPIGGEADDYFWVDELFVSTADSEAALGKADRPTPFGVPSGRPRCGRGFLQGRAGGGRPR